MKLLTTRGLIREVAATWEQQYRWCLQGDRRHDERKAEVLRRLQALDPETATAQDVAGVIGNDSWTDIRCNGCNTYVERAVQLGEEPDYESETATICVPCLQKAWELAK